MRRVSALGALLFSQWIYYLHKLCDSLRLCVKILNYVWLFSFSMF